jgi:YVTN family beta-propeller protein
MAVRMILHRSRHPGRALAARRRTVGARARRSIGALLIAVAVQLAVLGTALASFAGTKTAGPQALKSAKLPSPTALTTVNGGCAGGNEKTNVTATWTAVPVELDANANALVNGYTLWRAIATAGAYSSVGTTGAATSFTDVNPSGAEVPQVFVGNGGQKTVHALKTSTNEGASLATTGTIGSEPNSMAVNPEGTKLIVVQGASHQMQVITVSSHAVAAAVTIPEVAGVKSRPDAVAITPNGLTAYIVDGANNLVYPYTFSTAKLGTAIAVGAQGDPGAIVVTPDGTKVYVANYSAHSVSVITTASNTVTATVAIGEGTTGRPIALAVTPSSADVYVADQGNAQIDDITTSSDTVSKTITVPSMVDGNVAGGGDPNILAITPEGSKLYVASYTAGTVADIATSTDAVTKTITLAGTTPNPNALALTPNGCQLYVHDHANNLLDAITVSSDAVAASPAVGATGDPTGMSVTPDSAHVYVANHNANSVSVIATSTNTVSATLAEATVGKEPYAVLATPSPYFYKVQAGHVGGWQSALTASVAYPVGWNQGGWQ